jgi:hypothetical protein
MYGAEIYVVEDGWKASDIIRGRCYRGIMLDIVHCLRYFYIHDVSGVGSTHVFMCIYNSDNK